MRNSALSNVTYGLGDTRKVRINGIGTTHITILRAYITAFSPEFRTIVIDLRKLGWQLQNRSLFSDYLIRSLNSCQCHNAGTGMLNSEIVTANS